MSSRCTHENCFPDTTCALGHLDRVDCEHWSEKEEIEDVSAKEPQVSTRDVPWNGYALGTSDIAILSGRGQPLIIGLIGPPDSGKTSLLAFVYMWMLKHGKIGNWGFAGSWTLGGWESVVQHCRWTGNPPPSFPPHTTSAGRHPGVLHVTLRHRTTGVLRDVMFSDAPGEWFTRWSRGPGDPTAAGARWVIDHSDVLLLLIDSAALANSDKLPQTRRATRDLIDRVAAESGQRPLIVVWTKDDVTIPELTQSGLERACAEYLPWAETFRTSVNAPETIEKCFAIAISAAERVDTSFNVSEPRQSRDPFLAFRGIHVNT